MADIAFEVTTFRSLFPAFASSTTYPDATLEMYYDMATSYVSPAYGGDFIDKMNLKQQTLALNLMTAHVAQINADAATGSAGAGGVVTDAVIGEVQVSFLQAPAKNSWQYWLNQTAYGRQLLSLLQSAAIGGWYISPGSPVLPAFRR